MFLDIIISVPKINWFNLRSGSLKSNQIYFVNKHNNSYVYSQNFEEYQTTLLYSIFSTENQYVPN